MKRPPMLEIHPTDSIRIGEPSNTDPAIGTGSLEFHDARRGIYFVLLPPTDPAAAIAGLAELAARSTELRDAIAASFPDAAPRG